MRTHPSVTFLLAPMQNLTGGTGGSSLALIVAIATRGRLGFRSPSKDAS